MNIIPIIAKADTISKSELHKFKIKIMGELVSNGVQIYQFPTDDEAVAEINAVMNVSVGQRALGLWGQRAWSRPQATLFSLGFNLSSPGKMGGHLGAGQSCILWTGDGKNWVLGW